MKTLISLIGEQPIPNLLPIRHYQPDKVILVCSERTQKVAEHLKKKFDLNATIILTDAHRLDIIENKLKSKITDPQEVALNFTGGTKPMSIAAFRFASSLAIPCSYMVSEGKRSLLHEYTFEKAYYPPTLKQEVELGTLITIEDYLNAHLPAYYLQESRNDSGGKFEDAVKKVLLEEFDEVIQGVRPLGVGNQIEIDLVVRKGNQIAIVEVKLGGEEGPKKGLDQLIMAGRQEYLGTFTAKALVMAKKLHGEALQLHRLAEVSRIKIIGLPEYKSGKDLNLNERQLLISKIKEILT